MHASLWRFRGDPDRLLASYDAMVQEIPPSVMRLHLCLRATDGIVLVDTCPTRDDFVRFAGGDGFAALRARHGLPEPDRVEDFPVHRLFLDGAVAS